MKLLFIADGRSPIALNWMHYFVDAGHEVHLASIYPCQPDLELDSLTVTPVAFSSFTGEQGSGGVVRKIATPRVRTWLRHQFIPRSLPNAANNLQSLISNLQPDLIHAMRIPYEGMLAALADPAAPLLTSVWGNDFTLHAPATRKLAQLTRLTLARADALHTDCHRDLRLARAWGFDAHKPGVVLPGAGGIQMDVFYPPGGNPLAPLPPTVINPRGLRAYVRNDTFFKAIPRVLAKCPETRFLCTTMAGAPEAERWVSDLDIADAVDLLPRKTRAEMADLFRRAQVVVSPSTHDGTPNTLLEAMACGCFPVVGDIESLREWITDGENGFLVNPADPQALAGAIVSGLQIPELRARAREHNLRLIRERAEYQKVMGEAELFYQSLLRP